MNDPEDTVLGRTLLGVVVLGIMLGMIQLIALAPRLVFGAIGAVLLAYIIGATIAEFILPKIP